MCPKSVFNIPLLHCDYIILNIQLFCMLKTSMSVTWGSPSVNRGVKTTQDFTTVIAISVIVSMMTEKRVGKVNAKTK